MPVKSHLAADVLADRPSASVHQDGQWLDVTVAQRDNATTDIISLELICADGCPLPAYDAGAQVRIGRTLNNLNRCADASHTVLFAGGIWITHILNMVYALEAAGAS